MISQPPVNGGFFAGKAIIVHPQNGCDLLICQTIEPFVFFFDAICSDLEKGAVLRIIV